MAKWKILETGRKGMIKRSQTQLQFTKSHAASTTAILK
jgi:ethanolamine ammonia-lyase small subunit